MEKYLSLKKCLFLFTEIKKKSQGKQVNLLTRWLIVARIFVLSMALYSQKSPNFDA